MVLIYTYVHANTHTNEHVHRMAGILEVMRADLFICMYALTKIETFNKYKETQKFFYIKHTYLLTYTIY